jgi:uncharacterized membrane protein YkoI
MKKIGYATAATLGLFAGAAGIASAATRQSTPTPVTTAAPGGESDASDPAGNDANEPDGDNEGTGDDEGKDANETAIVGSIAAPAEQSADNEDHAAEDAALAKLATVTADEAKAAALAAVPGTAGDVRLEEEDGFVVYSVDVTTTSGDVEVTVDAGNAAILAQDSGGEHHGDHGDGGHGDGGHSNTDAAHEAGESPERAAQEATDDSQVAVTTG